MTERASYDRPPPVTIRYTLPVRSRLLTRSAGAPRPAAASAPSSCGPGPDRDHVEARVVLDVPGPAYLAADGVCDDRN